MPEKFNLRALYIFHRKEEHNSLITNNLYLDVSRKEIKSITVNQGDKNSRTWNVYFSNGGTQLDLSEITSISVFLMKPDNTYVFNPVQIDLENNCAILTFTDQMSAAAGTGTLQLSMYTYETRVEDEVTVGDLQMLYTFGIKVIISESSIPITTIVSSDEFQKLNDLIAKAESNFTDVTDTVKKYEASAEASAKAAKESEINAKASEDTIKVSEENAKASADNAKESETNAKASEDKAEEYAKNAKTSEDNAKESEINAKASETNAKTSADNASASEVNAKVSEESAKLSQDNAKISEDNAKVSETNAKASEESAKLSEDNAKESETNAKTSEDNAEEYYKLSRSYAVGDIDVRTDEKTDNSKYYYENCKKLYDNIGGVFRQKGQIKYENLPTDPLPGDAYQISNDFTSDSRFNSPNTSYGAGTIIYYTTDGKWEIYLESAGSNMIAAITDEFINALFE